MALICVGEPEDRRMDAKKIKDTRQRLSKEYDNPIRSINRNRIAAQEIKVENTEDEGDLATISHDKDLPSVATPKPAIHGHLKTGHFQRREDGVFYFDTCR